MEEFGLDGQVALVTGASRGIGRDIALGLGRLGAHVVINFAHNREAAASTLSELSVQNGSGELLPFDVAAEEQVEGAVQTIIDRHKKIAILVNNAGVNRDNLLVRQRPEDWTEVLNVNLKGIFHCTKSVSRRMIRERYGRIINITSITGQMGNVGQAVYSASKAGIIGFTKSMARELASRGITVNAVSPGFIDTEMTRKLSPEVRQRYLEAIPVGRFGTGGDVAMAVAFLAARASSYLTGQVININGGMYM